MPDILIFKDENNQWHGYGEKGRRGWDKWQRVCDQLAPGELIGFSYHLARSPRHHKFFFARLHALFDRQESFNKVEHLLEFLKMGAGHVHWIPSAGVLVPVPDSIDWMSLDEQEFTEVKRSVWDFLYTPQAQASLWPHLTPMRRYRMIYEWEQEGEEEVAKARARRGEQPQ